MSLVTTTEFTHILRISNTNVDGRRKIGHALTAIKGIGRRYANLCLKKADVDIHKRAGECTPAEIERVMTVVQNPRQFKIPIWFLNRRKEFTTGKNSHVFSNALDVALRDDLERLKKIRSHRGLRHYWGVKVRTMRTKSTGRGVNHKHGPPEK